MPRAPRALMMFLVLAACSAKKKREEPPPPPPPASDAAVPIDAPPPPPCITDVTLADKLDHATLQQTAAHCPGANLIAQDTTSYTAVFAALEALVADGFTNITIGTPASHAKAQLPAGTTRASQTNEGRIVGRFEEAAAGELPMIVIAANKDVAVRGTRVGALGDPTLAEAIRGALPEATATHSLVLQADGQATYGQLRDVVSAADTRGYTNVIFGISVAHKR